VLWHLFIVVLLVVFVAVAVVVVVAVLLTVFANKPLCNAPRQITKQKRARQQQLQIVTESAAGNEWKQKRAKTQLDFGITHTTAKSQ